jgi:hypothetical protein
MATGVGQIGHVGIEVLAAARAIMLGVEHDDVARPPGEGIAQIVKGTTTEPIAVGAASTIRAASPPVVPALDADLGFGQVLGAGDPHGGIAAVFARSWHGIAPERKVLSGNTPGDGKVFTDSARFLCYRLNWSVKLLRGCPMGLSR